MAKKKRRTNSPLRARRTLEEIRQLEQAIKRSGRELVGHPLADAARDRIRNRLRQEIESSRTIIDPTDNGGKS